MPIELSWYIPSRIVHMHVVGEVDLNDLDIMSQDLQRMVDEGVAPVHIFLDDAEGGRPPTSLSQMKSRLAWVQDDALGWIIGIGEANPVANFLIPLLLKVMKIDFRRCKTLDEGVAFLETQDKTLEYSESTHDT